MTWTRWKGVLSVTDNELRKIYYPIAESWKMMIEYADSTGTPVECFKVQEQAKDIFEKSGKTKFAEEIISAAVNEIDRIMRENGGD